MHRLSAKFYTSYERFFVFKCFFCLSDPQILYSSQNYFRRNLKKKLDKMSGIVINIVTILVYIWWCRIDMHEIHPIWKPVSLPLSNSLSPLDAFANGLISITRGDEKCKWNVAILFVCLFVCCFFMRNNVYRFLVQLFAIINLNDMQSMCIHSYSSHQHAHIHLPIVAYNTMHGHKHTHTPIPSLAPYKMVMRIESRNTMSGTLLPPNIPFVSAFTTHQNRFMCVLDTHTSSSFSRFRFHSHSRSRSARYSFIFRFYSIEHVLSERCTIKSD